MIGGVPLICRVSEALRPLSSALTVVAAEVGAYDDLGLTSIADTRPEMGPLGGLESALADRVERFGEGWILFSACDLAEPDAALADDLLQQVREGVQVVAYRDERWEPLYALYHSSIRDRVSQQLDAGQRAMWRLIEAVEHVAVALPEGVEGIGQLNTPEDLKRIQAKAD